MMLKYLFKQYNRKKCMFKKWKKKNNNNNNQKPELYNKYKHFRNSLCNQLKFAEQNFSSSLLDNESPSKRFLDHCKSRFYIHHSQQQSFQHHCWYCQHFQLFLFWVLQPCWWFHVPIPQHAQYDVTSHLSILQCSSDEIQSLVRKLQKNSAAGIDGITSMILKHTAPSISPILCSLFSCLEVGFPMPGNPSSPCFKAGDPYALSISL